jgi:hypothetical protein
MVRQDLRPVGSPGGGTMLCVRVPLKRQIIIHLYNGKRIRNRTLNRYCKALGKRAVKNTCADRGTDLWIGQNAETEPRTESNGTRATVRSRGILTEAQAEPKNN